MPSRPGGAAELRRILHDAVVAAAGHETEQALAPWLRSNCGMPSHGRLRGPIVGSMAAWPGYDPRPAVMEVHLVRMLDGDGNEINAELSVEQDGTQLAIIRESYSGGDSTRPPRNPQYRTALRTLIDRLRDLNATVMDALLDSGDTQRAGIPETDRRLIDAPVALSAVPDLQAFCRQLTNRQRYIARSPGKRGPGNGARRIRLRITAPVTRPATPRRLASAIFRVSIYHSPEEPRELPDGQYSEGAVTRVTVSKHERDKRAPKACLDHYGPRCQACGIDFGEAYGTLGDGFIDVHHIRELSTLGPGYHIDPVSDLRPICPNCPPMVHQATPAMPVADLRRLLDQRRQ